jgi:hypothetical protein
MFTIQSMLYIMHAHAHMRVYACFSLAPPTMGGNREELGVDHEEPECEDPLPPEEPRLFSDGTEIRTDTGICDALDMSEQGGLGEPCNHCRKCLTKHCAWEDDSFCKGLMEGRSIPEPWKSGLFVWNLKASVMS